MDQHPSLAAQEREPVEKTEDERRGRLRIVVDLNRCQSYAQCCFLAPDVFRLQGEEALTYYPEPDASRREEVMRAVAACPVQAITVETGDSPGDETEGKSIR
ncbi:MAG TPA: ferredoxin [Ktedonobacteraceae bacterium]|nr:ferredoxin [Ktedonobacteraceae bacterium]